MFLLYTGIKTIVYRKGKLVNEALSRQIKDAHDTWMSYHSKVYPLEKSLAPLYVEYLKFMHENAQLRYSTEDFRIVLKRYMFGQPMVAIGFEEIGGTFPTKTHDVPVAYFEDPETWKQEKLKSIAEAKAESERSHQERKRALYEQLKKEFGD